MTKPSLGFGSNQVDFGGIIMPESATHINSSSVTGYIANAATQSSLHLLINSGIPLIPPTKSILSSLLKSDIPKTGVKTSSVNSYESSCFTGLVLSTFSSLTFNAYHFLSK